MSDTEHRRQSVLRIYEALSAAPAEAAADTLESLFAPDARHHPAAEAGPRGAAHSFIEARSRMPGMIATVKRSAADGNLVAVHWHASADPDDEFGGESWCEVFRFDQDDRVVEHWVVRVEVPAATVSGRSVFSDAYRHDDPAQASAAVTEHNRAVATAAFERFLRFDPTVVADHWGDVYLQHNEMILDGADALVESLAGVGGLPEHLRPRFTVLETIAEGDLVWFLEEVRVGSETGFGVDIFRLSGGRIVEHWDVPAMRPDGPPPA